MVRIDYFDEATGLYSGVRYVGPEDDVAINTPPGCVPQAAVEFPHAMRLVAGDLIDYQPPQPDDDHDWDEESRRWVVKAAVLERQAKEHSIKAKIAALETSQARAMRELVLERGTRKDGSDMTAAELKEALTKIDDEIATLRSQLQP